MNFKTLFISLLPKEIVKWITSRVDLCYHLVEVSAQLVDTDLFTSRDEDARCVFLCDPAVLELVESIVHLLLRLE